MSFSQFAEEKLNHFINAVINIFLFLPHFFSVKHLLKTLFSPWKNLVETKQGSGLSLNQEMSRVSFNVISRLVGGGVRGAVIGIYIFVQIMAVLLLPIIFTGYVMLLPIFFFMNSSNTDEKIAADEQDQKEKFVTAHTLDQSNRTEVEKWYDTIVKHTSEKVPWYDKDKLLSVVPLARDWTAGFTPTMDKFCNNEVPSSYDIHLIGRTEELSQMEHILSKDQNANLMLVGDEGVGRETIIRCLSEKIYYGQVLPLLAYKRVLTIDLQKILSVSTDHISRLNTLSDIFKEAQEARNIILVIHDLDQYVSTIDGHIDCSDILSQYAASKINIIATSTPVNYQKYIYPNAKIHEIFTKIDIEEVSPEQCMTILQSLSLKLEDKYQIIIPYETILESINKASQFVGALPLPESAIQILNETSTLVDSDKDQKILTPDIIDKYLEQKLHVPVVVTDALKDKLIGIEQELNKQIIDQPQAIDALSTSLKNAFMAGGRDKKPLSTFLFLGPTGVGKTQTAKALSELFFTDKTALIRLDMPNYQTKEDIGRLIGDSQNPGELTQKIRNQPYGVLLLDEIEKANRDLLNIFLSVLDEGYFNDARGERVDCRSLIIIATSNAGADYIFTRLANNQTITTDDLLNELITNNIYSPEFLNRFDGVIIFQPLSPNSVLTIAQQIITQLDADLFASQGVHIEVSNATLSSLITQNYNPQFGARDLSRIIDFHIKEKISTKLLEEDIAKGSTIHL